MLIRSKKMRRVARFLLALAALIIIAFIFTAAAIVSYSTTHYSGSADAAVVLGAAAWGSRPSPVFQARIDHAISLYRSGRVKKIIFTGGSRNPKHPADSEVARDYALKQGVPRADILIETRSLITEGNLRFTKLIIRRHGFKKLMIVSDPLHMKRAILIAHQQGLTAYPAPTSTTQYKSLRSKFTFLLRETALYIGYILLLPIKD